MNFKQLVFFLFVFCGTFYVQTQNKQFKKAPLKEVLLVLEKEYKIKFSYPEKLIEGKNISLDYNELNFNEITQLLQQKTNLFFQKVTKRYLIISEKTAGNKSTACGYIVDIITEKSIEGASIITTNKLLGINTNKEGYFELKGINQKDSIQISFPGYLTTVLPVSKFSKTPCVILDLKEQSSWLEEVQIESYLTKGITKETNGSVVVSPKKLGILPGLTEPDVLQSIQLLPGINSPNETASGIHIRGGTPDQNLILFDGIKMYNSAHFFGMISAFNPYITKKIKVFRNGASAEYGNHISGVIDIETDDEVSDKLSGGFGTNLTHSDAYFKIPINNKVGFAISARRSFTDFIQSTTFNRVSKKVFQNTIISRNAEADQNFFESDNKFYFSDVNAKFIYQPSKKDKITLNYLLVRNKLNYQFNSKDKSYNTGDYLQIKNTGFRTKWNHVWSKTWTQNTSFYISNYNYHYNYNGLFNFNSVFTQSALKDNLIEDIGLKTVLEKEFNKRSKFSFGYEFLKNKINYNLSRSYSNSPSFDYNITEKNKNDTHAIFGEYVFKNENNTALHLGIRTNHFSLTNKTFFAPRIYGQIKLWKNILLKSSLETKQQNISQLIEFDTSDFGLENQVWILADNNNVPILKSNQFTLGFVFEKDNWTLDIDFYRKKINGLTSFIRGFTNATNFNSIGDSFSQGIDILIKKKWSNYNSWISYSYSDTNYMFKDLNNENSFAGNFDATHNFLWTHSLKSGNFDFSLGWNFRTGIPYTPATSLDSNDQVIYGTINSERLPNYHKLDFSTTYSFNFDSRKKWKGKIGLSLLNIYDKSNVLVRTFESVYDTTFQRNILKKVDNVSLGFTPNLVFRVDF